MTCLYSFSRLEQYFQYCNEKGGTVLNAAILLNGEKPVEVTLERIPEQKVVFDSRDMDVHGEFDTIEPLQLVDGKLVCGAGGGGFLQVILKKGVTRQMVEERLKEVFMDSLVGVADCNLVWE